METLCNKEFLGTSSITALMREMELVLGLGRAYFFGPEPSPSLFFQARAQPGLLNFDLEPVRAKKISNLA